jgi:hypothetical protein
MLRVIRLIATIPISSHSSAQPDAREIVEKAMDQYRGKSSYGEMTMVIHRPVWERTTSMQKGHQ